MHYVPKGMGETAWGKRPLMHFLVGVVNRTLSNLQIHLPFELRIPLIGLCLIDMIYICKMYKEIHQSLIDYGKSLETKDVCLQVKCYTTVKKKRKRERERKDEKKERVALCILIRHNPKIEFVWK